MLICIYIVVVTWQCSTYLRTYIYVYINHVLLLFSYVGPSALTVKIMKSIETFSIVVQWDVVDNFLPTTYTIIWGDHNDQFDTVEEQTSYTITGLTLDTVYTIYVTAANWCGQAPEFRTIVSFSTDTTSTTSSISPTVIASTNPMTVLSIVNSSSTTTTTTTAITSSSAAAAATTTTIVKINPATTAVTTDSMTIRVSRSTSTSSKTININIATTSLNPGTTITTAVTNLSAIIAATTTTVIKGSSTTTATTNDLCM